ncbi:MAG: hypothetical protein NTU47_10360 [Ignavibacteriales bacterium]|nr:hypothetical protein [Ignavibacteriales bacterium]
MRHRWIEILLIGCGLMMLPVGCAVGQRNALSEREEIKKSFRLSDNGHRQLVVDNINGEINVVGYDGDSIELVAHKEIKAESGEKIEEAKREVTLEIREEKNKIILYVDAPWRRGDGIHYRGWHYYGYDVTYDFDLKVPRKISLYLKTINHGKVLVQSIEGEFEVNNVNAGIEMSDINGPAIIRTVNGPIKASFTKNPGSDCSFKTVNGKIEVVLHDGLNADMKLKTFNGKVYTDFDVSSVPRENRTVEERKGSRRIYRRGGSQTVRVGKGGPEFSFDTLNGSIYVLKHD